MSLETLTTAINDLTTSTEASNQRVEASVQRIETAIARLIESTEATNQQLAHLSELLTVYIQDSNDRLTRIERQLERVANITESQAATAAALANLVTELATRR